MDQGNKIASQLESNEVKRLSNSSIRPTKIQQIKLEANSNIAMTVAAVTVEAAAIEVETAGEGNRST